MTKKIIIGHDNVFTWQREYTFPARPTRRDAFRLARRYIKGEHHKPHRAQATARLWKVLQGHKPGVFTLCNEFPHKCRYEISA